MQKKTLIIGSSPCAQEIAAKLLEKDFEVILATKDADDSFPDSTGNGRFEILAHTRLLKCTGFWGDFAIHMHQNDQHLQRSVSTIVIAEQEKRNPNFSLYGLTPSESVLSLSQLKTRLAASTPDRRFFGKKVVFVSGLLNEADPVLHNEVMASGLALQTEFNCQVYVLTDNLKVAGTGLEALYRKTRDAGVIYIKSADHSVSISSKEKGRITVDYFDEVIRSSFKLSPDLIIVDETISPSDDLIQLTDILNLDRDTVGFAQTENVHRIPVFTNRKGILVAGSAGKVQPFDDHRMDASNAVLSVVELLKGDPPQETLPKAEIDPGHCVRCLTCYRLCPFQAVELGAKPVISTLACEGCGICAGECPKHAIRISGLSGGEMLERVSAPLPGISDRPFVPRIVAFCCSRSAMDAWKAASQSGKGPLPRGLKIIELPCAGAVADEHVFSAFSKKADGIMVLTCHDGNCHSERGNRYARERLKRVTDALTRIGIEKERLIVKSIAANMATEFSEFVCDFERQLQALGPSRL